MTPFKPLTAMSCLLLLNTSVLFSEETPQTIKSTFLITGLHCPPCTSTVENSLKSVKGVKSAKVDWKTKNATLEFDEKLISAQQLANRIATTPHMMGGSLRYSGWLALRVPEINAAGNAEKATEALKKVTGVASTHIYKEQKSVGIAFDAKGDLTTAKLIDALKEAGLEASVYP